MNRLKRELRNRGLKLECDYPMIPFDMGSQSLDGIDVNSETATVRAYYSSLIIEYQMRRNGMLIVSHN